MIRNLTVFAVVGGMVIMIIGTATNSTPTVIAGMGIAGLSLFTELIETLEKRDVKQ